MSVYQCTCVSACVYMYVYMSECGNVYQYMCVNVCCMNVSVSVYVFNCVNICTSVCE